MKPLSLALILLGISLRAGGASLILPLMVGTNTTIIPQQENFFEVNYALINQALTNAGWTSGGTGVPGEGTVTSVGLSTTVSGLTVSGTPVTGAGTLALSGTVAIAGGGTGATTASGSRTNLGLVIGADVQAYNPALSAIGSLPSGTATNFFAGDGTFKQVTTNMIPGLVAALASGGGGGGGSGTVTSVGISMPTSVFDVAGSPVTTSGALAVTFDAQSANTTFSGPTTGSPATPSFRALVTADIPSAVLFDSEALAIYAPIAGPAFTGTVTIGATNPVAELALKAPLASPSFTGTPSLGSAIATTASPGDNDTSVATTAFAQAALAFKAPLASPAFTGNPTVPTATPGDNDTSAASTAFVTAAVTAGGGVSLAGTNVWTGTNTFTANTIFSSLTITNATANTLVVGDLAYSSAWNGSNGVPTLNAVYDKIETLSASLQANGTAGVTNLVNSQHITVNKTNGVAGFTLASTLTLTSLAATTLAVSTSAVLTNTTLNGSVDYQQTTLAAHSTVTNFVANLSGSQYQYITPLNLVCKFLHATNAAAGRQTVFIINSGTNASVSVELPSNIYVGNTNKVSMGPNQLLSVSMYAYGSNNTNVVAAMGNLFR